MISICSPIAIQCDCHNVSDIFRMGPQLEGGNGEGEEVESKHEWSGIGCAELSQRCRGL